MGAKIYLEDIEEIGHVIKKIRQSKNLTQDEVAQLAGIDKKHLRGIEKGKYSVGMSLFLLICEALEVNHFEILTIAWSDDYNKFVEQEQINMVNTKTKTNDEVSGIANNGQTLRLNGKIRVESKTKCLYGGGNSAIIKLLLNKITKRLAIFKLRWKVCKISLKCLGTGLSI
ncbi:MAG: helix-turn-helix transcriptional regulator [Phascolarctobacterium sp.]|nr:helix-turn-helix transcriptional regulator [Phascolarctobacterium sp.]